MKKAKFELQDLFPIGITIVVLGIALSFGLQIIGDTQDDIGVSSCAARTDGYTTYSSTTNLCSNSTGATSVPGTAQFNATGDTITGLAKLPAKLPIIVTVIVAAVLIGILTRYLMVK